jgi:hypothetical protein
VKARVKIPRSLDTSPAWLPRSFGAASEVSEVETEGFKLISYQGDSFAVTATLVEAFLVLIDKITD